MIVAIIIPDHDGKCVKSFSTSLRSTGWCLSSTETAFPTNGDTISSSCRIIIGIHSSCASIVEPLLLKPPPPSLPRPHLFHALSAYHCGSPSIDQNILCPWQKMMMTLCARMSNSPRLPLSRQYPFLQGLWLNTLQGIYACRRSRGVVGWPLSTFRCKPE
jgi:hypothetical protein